MDDFSLLIQVNIAGLISLYSLSNLNNKGECAIPLNAFGDLSKLVLLDFTFIFLILLNDFLFSLSLISEMFLNNVGSIGEENKQDEVD